MRIPWWRVRSSQNESCQSMPGLGVLPVNEARSARRGQPRASSMMSWLGLAGFCSRMLHDWMGRLAKNQLPSGSGEDMRRSEPRPAVSMKTIRF